MVVPALDGEDAIIDPYVLPDSPDVLSIGRRCVDQGYGFYWKPYSQSPALIPPDAHMPRVDSSRASKEWTWLEVDDYIPYLVDTHNPLPNVSQGKSCPMPLARARECMNKGETMANVVCNHCGKTPWQAELRDDGKWQLVAKLDVTSSNAGNVESATFPDVPTNDTQCQPCMTGLANSLTAAGAALSVPAVAAPEPVEDVVEAPGHAVDWRAESQTLEHLLTHKPFNIYCDVCRRSKPQRAAKPNRAKARAKLEDGDPKAGRDKLEFGDRCTGDWFLQRRAEYKGSKEKYPDEFALFPGAKAAVQFLDLATDWRETQPRCCRTTEETRKAVQHFQGPDERIKQFYADGAPELKRALLDEGIINPYVYPWMSCDKWHCRKRC